MIKILLPIYNESESIYDLLENYSNFFNTYPQKHIIYCINDKSIDDTKFYIEKAIEKYKNLAIKYIENSVNKGLAKTLKDNIETIIKNSEDDDILITMDGDNTHDPFTIQSMLQKLQDGADIVICSRYCVDSTIKGLSYKRIVLSQMARILYCLIWNIKGVKDYTSNYRAYKMYFLKKLFKDKSTNFIKENGYNAIAELLKNVSEYNPVITEVPMTLNYSNKKSASNLKIVKTIFQTLKMLLSV